MPANSNENDKVNTCARKPCTHQDRATSKTSPENETGIRQACGNYNCVLIYCGPFNSVAEKPPKCEAKKKQPKNGSTSDATFAVVSCCLLGHTGAVTQVKTQFQVDENIAARHSFRPSARCVAQHQRHLQYIVSACLAVSHSHSQELFWN